MLLCCHWLTDTALAMGHRGVRGIRGVSRTSPDGAPPCPPPARPPRSPGRSPRGGGPGAAGPWHLPGSPRGRVGTEHHPIEGRAPSTTRLERRSVSPRQSTASIGSIQTCSAVRRPSWSSASRPYEKRGSSAPVGRRAGVEQPDLAVALEQRPVAVPEHDQVDLLVDELGRRRARPSAADRRVAVARPRSIDPRPGSAAAAAAAASGRARRRCRGRPGPARSARSRSSVSTVAKSPAWTIRSARSSSATSCARQPPGPARHVGVGHDDDVHAPSSGTFVPAPVVAIRTDSSGPTTPRRPARPARPAPARRSARGRCPRALASRRRSATISVVRDRDRDAAAVAQRGQHQPVAGRALDLGSAGERRRALDRERALGAGRLGGHDRPAAASAGRGAAGA